MFQFPACICLSAYAILRRFSHSEILGSKLACSSPRLIAACHVLLHNPSQAIHQWVCKMIILFTELSILCHELAFVNTQKTNVVWHVVFWVLWIFFCLRTRVIEYDSIGLSTVFFAWYVTHHNAPIKMARYTEKAMLDIFLYLEHFLRLHSVTSHILSIVLFKKVSDDYLHKRWVPHKKSRLLII